MSVATHNCPVTGCDKQMPQHLLMCPAHWRLVPEGLQRAVNRNWRNGNTKAYLAARAQAITAVNALALKS